MPKENIQSELKQLSSEYSKSDVGKIVDAPNIGKALKKRRDKFKIKIEPKSTPKIDRLFAKIFYEFLFLINGKITFEKVEELEPIYNFINAGIKSDKVFI